MVGESASKGSPFVRDKGTALTDNHPEVPGAKRDGLASGVKHKDPESQLHQQVTAQSPGLGRVTTSEMRGPPRGQGLSGAPLSLLQARSRLSSLTLDYLLRY